MADFLVTFDGKYINYLYVYSTGGTVLPNFNHTNFNIIYSDKTGRIFCYKNFMNLFNNETHEFLGYFPIEEFYSKSYVDIKKNEELISLDEETDSKYLKIYGNIYSKDGNEYGIQPTKKSDRIYLVKRIIEFNESENKYIYKVIVKSFNYPNRNLDFELLNYDFDLINESLINNSHYWEEADNYQANFVTTPYEVPFHLVNLSTYVKNIKLKKYLSPNSSSLVDLSQNQIDTIEDVSIIFDHLFRETGFVSFINSTENNLRFIFDKHFEIVNDVTFTVIDSNTYYTYFKDEYFKKLRVRLLEFYYWARRSFHGGILQWLTTRTEVLTWIFGLFDEETLKFISKTDKINLLTSILKDNFWLSGRWNPFSSKYKLTEEETVVKIIRSISRKLPNGQLNYTEIDEFMVFLNSKKKEIDDSKTIFQILYERINDDILFGDDGKGARGQFVNAVYLLWLDSKFNPNVSDEVKSAAALANFTFTSNNAQWKFYDNTVTDEIDYTCAPPVIPYKSEKELLWYVDNFNFLFIKNKIYAYQETDKPWGELLADIFKYLVLPFTGPPSTTKYALYGTYDIYQPISVVAYNENETIIKLPLNPSGNPCDPNSVKNTFPIFYLKYLDDLGDYSDAKNTVSTILDVVLTFTGVGNLAKLRHLSKLSHITRYAALEPAKKLMVRRALQGLVGTIEFIAGTASIVNNLVTDGCTNNFPCNGNPPAVGTPEYNKYKACQTLQAWLFALEILSLSGDLLARRYFKKMDEALKQQKNNVLLLEKSDDSNISVEDFNALKQELFNALDSGSLSDLVAELGDFVSSYPIIANKLDELNLNIAQKTEFMQDFADNSEALIHFSANLNHIDNWKKLHLLDVPDKNILNIVKDSALTNSFEKLYTRTTLRVNLNKLTKERRLEFADIAKNRDTHWLDRLAERPNALNRWNNSAQARAIAKQNPRIWLYIADDLPVGTSFSKVPGNSTKWQLVDLNGIVHCRFKLTGPPPKINFESYIKFKKLTIAQQDALRTSATNTFRSNVISGGNAYTTQVSHLGQPIPRSNAGNGVSPDFSGLEMAFGSIPPPYILGNGKTIVARLSEPLENILQKIKISGEVRIPITGDRTKLDYANAWRKMGVKPSDGNKLMKELKLTWHHVDDLDNDLNSTLQLVTEKAHLKTIKHSGSVKQSDVLFDEINNLP